MDPNQTLADLLDACEKGNREQAFASLEALLDWLSKGGCFPEVKRDGLRNFWIGVPKP